VRRRRSFGRQRDNPPRVSFVLGLEIAIDRVQIVMKLGGVFLPRLPDLLNDRIFPHDTLLLSDHGVGQYIPSLPHSISLWQQLLVDHASCVNDLGRYQEYKLGTERYGAWFDPPVRVKDGTMTVPTGPGVGIKDFAAVLKGATEA